MQMCAYIHEQTHIATAQKYRTRERAKGKTYLVNANVCINPRTNTHSNSTAIQNRKNVRHIWQM